MDIIMMREEPLFRKCCFVLPLRLCLQTWACIKLVADVLAMSYFILVAAILYSYDNHGFFYEPSIYHWLVLVAIALLVDLGFVVALICGLFRKSTATLRIFYYYEFYALLAETVLLVLICIHIRDSICIILPVLYILLELCIIVTVKSEMIKLRNKDQFDFSRMPVCETDVEGTGKFKTGEERMTSYEFIL